jgi:hypothetical protein
MTDRVRAVHSYSAQDPDELPFSVNDIIDVIGPTDDSTWWWYGTVHGRFGMFPFNFVVSKSSRGLLQCLKSNYRRPYVTKKGLTLIQTI